MLYNEKTKNPDGSVTVTDNDPNESANDQKIRQCKAKLEE
jgi:hypothetical protein